jgi:hypothetical protein
MKEYVTLKIDEIIPYDRNPRENDQAVDDVAESIVQCGYRAHIIVDENNVIICGHTRLKALKKLGWKEVEVQRELDMTEAQKKKYRLLDNKVAEKADWNYDLLAWELEDVDFEGYDFGFELPEDEEYDTVTAEKDNDFFYFSKEEIIDDEMKEFKHYASVEEFAREIMCEAKAKHEFNRLCQGYNEGYNISLLFNPHRLDTATNHAISIFEAINSSDDYRRALAKFIVNVQNKACVSSEFYKYIGIGSGGIQYVNEFQPYLARDIYKTYCNDGYTVLDPCSGWGGRTLGLASCMFNDIRYITSDPSTKTYNGLLKLKEFLRLGDNYEYHNVPFEELELEDESVDFAFTSPPYFDTERYSDEDTQSWKRSSNYEQWRDSFLYVLLDKVYRALKHDRYCLLNVGKVRYPIDTDILAWLHDRDIECRRVSDFKIGGFGIGARTDEDGEGEPFIEFRKV